PYVTKHIPRLYPEGLSNVFIHHDAASSHTAKKTQAYAAELKVSKGVKLIKNGDIPVKSPDASPMDFFGFGYLKKRIGRRVPTTENGLWKVLQEEWRRVDLSMVNRVYRSWRARCRLIVHRNGNHIERVNYLDKFRIFSFALGPIIVGLLLVLGWCTWKMTARRQRIRTAIEIDGLSRYREMELESLVPTLSATNTEIQGQVNRNPELIATTILMEFDGNLDASIMICGGTLKCTRSTGEEGRIIVNPLYGESAAGQEIPTPACSPTVLERVAGASINHVRLSDQKHSGRENCFAFTQTTENDGFSWVFNGHTDENTGNDCYPQREEQEEEGTIEKRDEFKNCLQIHLSENLNKPNYLCMWESTTELL
ncbi:unnamed protein product, partial [Allacma fusca]